MRRITFLTTFLMTVFMVTQAFAQPRAAVVGANHLTPDGFSFVALENLTAGEIIYFTDREYNNGTNVFNTGEFVVTFTVGAGGISQGTVIFLNEVSSNNLTVTCTGGGSCGTVALNGSFAIGTDGDEFYAYSDTDADPSNGVTEIYAVLYTGASLNPGGNIPASQNPLPDFANAIVIDGFPAASPSRTEYQFSPATLRDGVSQAQLENPANYLHAQANAGLSVVEFTNLNLAGANPELAISRAPGAVAENSGSSITYTFTLSAAAASNTTINFSVGGSATFTTDYTQSGATSFNASTGTIVINSGTTMASLTITPVGDTMLEPNETVVLTGTAGTGYDLGASSTATGTISNDDTMAITPLIAIVGTNHTGTDGFSFVALDDIPASSTFYFTENPFNINTLSFSGSEGVMSWTSPGSVVSRGEVIVAMETGTNTFTTTCNSGTCGTVAIVSGAFSLATNGEAFFAYQDTDTDHTNGVTQVDAVLFTGTTVTPGGNVPALEDPSAVYTGAVVVDGFGPTAPSRTEYRFPPERGVTVDQADFQNTANWFNAAAAGNLDTTPFANIIISSGSTNPTLTLAVAPGTTAEDSGTPLVFTFTLSAPAAAATTVNFSVAGSATLTTDYTVSGADTFTASAGTATIPMGGTSVAVTVTPVVDTMVEPTETVNLMIASGTGYDGGSPNSATGNITNDDTSASDPLVAVMGMSHLTDGFSFAAAQDIPAGTVVYFTDSEFDNMTLLFQPGEAVLQWTSPGGGQIDQGDVITITETAPNTFAVACSDTSGAGCGSISLISGSFSLGTDGESLFAYEDADTDPTNGVTDIYGVMYTGAVGSPGGNLPAIEDPTGIFLNALVVDGFPTTQPDKTEYTPADRAIPVGSADFEDPMNYDHAFAFGGGLSTVPFANLSIIVSFTAPADLCIDAGVQTGLSGGSPTGGVYSGPGVTDDGNGMTYSFDPAAAGVGVHTITYTLGGGSASDDIEVFALPVVAFTAPADLCVDAGVQTGLGGGTPAQGTAAGDSGVYSGPGVTDDGNGMTYSFDPAAAGVGTHTITYSYTDGNGCSASASDDVEVFALPTVTFTALADVCVNAGVQTGNGGGTPTGGVYSGPGVTDDGNGMTYSFDPAAAGVGTHTITYTFTDTNSCTASASDDVEVFAAPVVTFTALADLCVNAGLQTGQGGGTPVGGTYSGPGVIDDGNGTTYTFDPAAAGVGTHTITYTFTDTNSCTASASDDVEVFALPTVTFTALADLCIDAGVQTGLGGGTPTGGVYTGPGVTDDGNGMTYSFDPAAAGAGVHTLTYTFTDGNGCVAAASDDVEVFALPTVTFTAPPSPVCPGDVLTGQGGGLPAGGVYSGLGVTDDGNGMTYSFDSGVSGNGVITITYTFTDGNGCTASASDTVTVEDTIAPMITCPADITVECSQPVTYPAPTFSDNCNFRAVPASVPGFTLLGSFGNSTYFISDADVNGPTAFADALANGYDIVTVSDQSENDYLQTTVGGLGLLPAFIGYNDVATEGSFEWQSGQPEPFTNWGGGEPNNAGGSEDYVRMRPDGQWNDINATTTSRVIIEFHDYTAGAIQITGLASGETFPLGVTTNLFYVEDFSGNSATCSFTVTVTDTIPPTITCPADITVNNDPGLCEAAITVPLPMVMDNCGNVIRSTTGRVPFNFDTSDELIDTPATLTGQMSATADVVIALNYSGDFTSGSGSECFELNGPDGTQVYFECGAGPTCSIIDRTITIPQATWNGWITTFGSDLTFTLLADTSVDEGQCSSGPENWFQLTGPGDLDLVNDYNGTSDASDTYPVGTTVVTWTVTDDAGNTATCTQNITVIDNEAPVITCPADITVNNDPGVCAAAVTVPAPTFMDNCPSGTNFTAFTGPLTGFNFTSGELVDTPTTLTGLTTSFDNVAIDILVDGDFGDSDEAFALNGPDGTLIFTENEITGSDCDTANRTFSVPMNTWNGWISTFGSDLTFTLLADDDVDEGFGGCDDNFQLTANIALSSTIVITNDYNNTADASDTYPVGTTTVTWTATDVAGNSSTCTMDITVVDNEPPVAVCMDITVQLDATGNASITAADVDGGSTDNCGIASLAVSPSTFTCADVGPNTVTLTVTDTAGLTSTCTAVVTVEDNIPPVAVCMDITVDLDATGNASITAADVDGGSTDACGIASIMIDRDTFTCADVGPNNVTLTVTDVNGNSSSCVAVVTVQDVTDPVIACPADITVDNDTGVCGAQVFFADAIATDACGIASVIQTAGDPSGSVFPVGTTTIEFTATDVNGNTAVCTFDITVNDVEPPVAVCQDITIQLDATGNASIVAADIDGGSTDNCGIASISASQTDFTCADVGDNNVTLTVTDVNGNSSTCIAVVTVEDVTSPVAVCMDITVELDVNGMVTIDPSDVDGGSSDACGIGSLSLDIDTFDCSNVGDNPVVLTVTDVNGNTDSCTAIVTVEDNIAPDLVCMDITVELDENGMAVITPEDVIASNTDACGINTTAVDIFEFTCDDIGAPITVTVFSVDNNANKSVCTALVTVIDALPPVVTCPADQTVDPGAGNLFYEVPDYFATGEASAVDNCTDPVTITSQDPAPGTEIPDGVYTVTLTAEDEYGNVGTCSFELTVESVLGVEDNVDLSNANIILYPNPAINQVMLSNPQGVALDEAAIYDMTGRLVITHDLTDMGSEKALDISTLATATYTVIIKGQGGFITKQLVKE